MLDESSLPKQVQERWMNWVNQVPVCGFNGRKYDLNLIKEYFIRALSNMNDVTVMTKDNSYMFLMTPMFKCNEECIGYKDCKRVRSDCTQCAKNKPYKLLKTGMVGGPSIIFCRYAVIGVSQIRSHKYMDAKSTNGWDIITKNGMTQNQPKPPETIQNQPKPALPTRNQLKQYLPSLKQVETSHCGPKQVHVIIDHGYYFLS